MPDEFSPLLEIQRLARLWWLMVLTAVIGGLLGFAFSRLNPPEYEAVATFFVSVDLTKTPKPRLELHDEDLALATTNAVIMSPPVIDHVLAEAKEMGQALDRTALLRAVSVERRHAFWELRYRSTDPAIAQTMANLWAEKTYEQILVWQEDGRAVSYLIFSAPTLAGLPDSPVRFDTNRLVLAGSMLGWLIGILISNLASQARHKTSG